MKKALIAKEVGAYRQPENGAIFAVATAIAERSLWGLPVFVGIGHGADIGIDPMSSGFRRFQREHVIRPVRERRPARLAVRLLLAY